MRRILSICSLLIIALFFTYNVSAKNNNNKDVSAGDLTIGIAMPSKALERWEKDGNYMVDILQEMGYQTDLQYAQDDVPTQVNQIENMISKGVDLLIVAPIDGGALSTAVEMAENNDIPVISYDRLILHTGALDYYATFDNFRVGQIQGQYIVDALDLEANKGPFNVELFGGAPDDNNAHFFYSGAIDTLTPYIASGQIKIKSGQQEFNRIAIQNWDSAEAQSRMDNLLSAYYTQDTVDAILAPNDAIAIGVVSSLQSVGYGSAERPMPIITGQDAEAQSIKSIIAGNQTMTVFKNTQALASVAVQMADQVNRGEDVTVNDAQTYDNGVKVIPANLLEPMAVDVSNYEELLIDSGYLSEADIK